MIQLGMNITEHILGGIAAGAITKSRITNSSLEIILLKGIYGAIGSLLPDIIEPPNNPGHRKTFHSVSVGIALILIFNKIPANSPEKTAMRVSVPFRP